MQEILGYACVLVSFLLLCFLIYRIVSNRKKG
jgi:hypothetical protein